MFTVYEGISLMIGFASLIVAQFVVLPVKRNNPPRSGKVGGLFCPLATALLAVSCIKSVQL